jgi:hypothetical protein
LTTEHSVTNPTKAYSFTPKTFMNQTTGYENVNRRSYATCGSGLPVRYIPWYAAK